MKTPERVYVIAITDSSEREKHFGPSPSKINLFPV